MKKLIWLVIILLSCFTLSACGKEVLSDQLIILTTNDFHGALMETDGNYGIARTASYIDSIRVKHPNGTVLLSAGDTYQGSAYSNITFGLSVVEAMNMMKFDAMTIGNHEFDWGIDTILQYRDGISENGEANFPYVTANIYHKATNALLNNTEEYTIVERLGVKIGIVGYIGYGLESSIATNMVDEYEFRNPVTEVARVAKELRKNHDVDLIIALGHDGSDATNSGLANLSGDERVDVIINGHLHLNVAKSVKSSDGRYIPIIQAGTAGEYLGEIEFKINREDSNNLEFILMNVKNVEMNYLITPSLSMQNYIGTLNDKYADILGRIIGVAGKKIVKQDVETWGADILMQTFDADFGVINMGGIRSVAFPIANGQNITVEKMYQIMPFDNTVKLCYLTGAQLITLASKTGLAYSSNYYRNGNNIQIDGVPIVHNQYYKVATIDYIFDNPAYPFLTGEQQEATFILFRDVMIEQIEYLTKNSKRWLE